VNRPAEGCGGHATDLALPVTAGGIAESRARERDSVGRHPAEAGDPMAKGSRVTVVIPLYDKARYVGRCLKSVRRQTCRDFSTIVVDDGSTDGSAEAARPCLGPGDRLVHQANAGAAAARNTGLELAETELVAFLDADDEWLRESLDLVLKLHDRFPEAGAYGTAYQVRSRCGRHGTRLSRAGNLSSDPAFLDPEGPAADGLPHGERWHRPAGSCVLAASQVRPS